MLRPPLLCLATRTAWGFAPVGGASAPPLSLASGEGRVKPQRGVDRKFASLSMQLWTVRRSSIGAESGGGAYATDPLQYASPTVSQNHPDRFAVQHGLGTIMRGRGYA